MKKVFILSIAIWGLSIFTSPAFATNQNTGNTKTLLPTSVIQQSRNQDVLNDAIRQRQKNYYNDKAQTMADKNMYYRITQAAKARKAAHVASGGTTMKRTGNLTNWRKSRSYQQPSSLRPNFNTYWRACILNYYFNGGNCTKDELKEGLIYSSTYKVSRVPNVFWTRDIEVINRLRNTQRNLPSRKEKIGAGQQRQRALQKGDSSRSYTSPYTKSYFTPE